MHFARERIQQDASGQIGGLGSIRVGRGLETDKNVAEPGQTGRDVAVQIERACDGDLWTYEGTYLAHENRLRRTDPFGVHRSVEPQEDGIDRQRGPQGIQDPIHRRPARLLLDGPAAIGAGVNTGNNGQAGLLPDGWDIAANIRKIKGSSLDRMEGVSLVGKPAHKDPPPVARAKRLRG